MWKKDDEQVQRPIQTPTGTAAPRPERSATQPRKTGYATIGPSIVIKGEVTGDEDLLIQGHVDGSVALGLHSVTIGDGGRVKAGITGRVITVEGTVEGDLSAEEQIILRGTARVKGDLMAPRVVLEDGATFRGLVDMGSKIDQDAAKSARKEREESRKPAPPASGPGDAKPKSLDSGSANVPVGADKAKATAPSDKAATAGSTVKSATG